MSRHHHELLSGSRQQLLYHINHTPRPTLYLLSSQAAQGMLHNGNGESGQSQSTGFDAAQGDKFGRADGSGGDTTFFELNGIVDTPRRT